MIVDAWNELHTMFEGPADKDADIYMLDVPPDDLTACLQLVLGRSRECTTFFYESASRTRVTLPRMTTAMEQLSQGVLIGGMWLTMPLLPGMGFFVQEPRVLTINYSFGVWSALSVLALLDLLHELKAISPRANFYLDGTCFNQKDQRRFQATWREYAHGTR